MVTKQQFNEKQHRDVESQNYKNALRDLVGLVQADVMNRPVDTGKSDAENALRVLMRYYKLKVPEFIDADASIEALLSKYLRPTGMMRRRVELNGKWWTQTTGPLLASLKRGDLVILIPKRFGGYHFFNKETNRYEAIGKGNVNDFETDAFMFYEALPSEPIGVKALVVFMMKQLSLVDFGLLLGICLLVSLLGLFMPFMNQQIFNNTIPSGTKGDVGPISILLVGAAFGTAVFQIARNMMLMRLKEKVTIAVQSATMARLFMLPTGFFKKYTSGEISKRVMSITELSNKLSDSVLSSLLTAIFAGIYIFQMSYLAPELVGVGLSILLVMFIFTLTVGIVQQRRMRKRLKFSAKLEGLIFSLFSGIQKIKLAGAEKRAFIKWSKHYRNQGEIDFKPPFIVSIHGAIGSMMVLAGTIILFYMGVASEISVSSFIAFQISYGIVSGAVMSLADVIMTFSDVKPLLEMVMPILETSPEVNVSKTAVTSLSGRIELSNVCFRYDPEGPLILNHVDLKIKAGEYVAIVGGSGSGKSTLLRLLLGFEIPDSGAVYYDDYDLEALDVQSVRQQIGTCLQDGKLFAGDLFSNIIVSAPWSTLDEAWRAAEMAGLKADIEGMPMGMNTMISEGAGNISGGQKQRILIARALISNPNILYFDEATSALDNVTQKSVTENVNKLGCTRLVIAHRLSTVRYCDRIIVLEKGLIVESGRYETLMANKGQFYELAIRQMT